MGAGMVGERWLRLLAEIEAAAAAERSARRIGSVCDDAVDLHKVGCARLRDPTGRCSCGPVPAWVRWRGQILP